MSDWRRNCGGARWLGLGLGLGLESWLGLEPWLGLESGLGLALRPTLALSLYRLPGARAGGNSLNGTEACMYRRGPRVRVSRVRVKGAVGVGLG